MPRQGTWLSIQGIAFLLLSGCVTFTIPLPPQLEADNSSAKLNRRVLLVVSEQLARSEYSTSQALTRWEYPLGEALPRHIEESLRGVFTHVDRSTDDSRYGNYDLVVHPQLWVLT